MLLLLVLKNVVWRAAAPPGCSMQPGVAFHATPTYNTVQSLTAADCCAACAADWVCTGFTFQDSNRCHLKQGHAFNGSAHEGCTSGAREKICGGGREKVNCLKMGGKRVVEYGRGREEGGR